MIPGAVDRAASSPARWRRRGRRAAAVEKRRESPPSSGDERGGREAPARTAAKRVPPRAAPGLPGHPFLCRPPRAARPQPPGLIGDPPGVVSRDSGSTPARMSPWWPLMHGNEIAGAIVLDALLRGRNHPFARAADGGVRQSRGLRPVRPSDPTASRFLEEDMNRLWARGGAGGHAAVGGAAAGAGLCCCRSRSRQGGSAARSAFHAAAAAHPLLAGRAERGGDRPGARSGNPMHHRSPNSGHPTFGLRLIDTRISPPGRRGRCCWRPGSALGAGDRRLCARGAAASSPPPAWHRRCRRPPRRRASRG